jgi:hypothetical protein
VRSPTSTWHVPMAVVRREPETWQHTCRLVDLKVAICLLSVVLGPVLSTCQFPCYQPNQYSVFVFYRSPQHPSTAEIQQQRFPDQSSPVTHNRPSSRPLISPIGQVDQLRPRSATWLKAQGATRMRKHSLSCQTGFFGFRQLAALPLLKQLRSRFCKLTPWLRLTADHCVVAWKGREEACVAYKPGSQLCSALHIWTSIGICYA